MINCSLLQATYINIAQFIDFAPLMLAPVLHRVENLRNLGIYGAIQQTALLHCAKLCREIPLRDICLFFSCKQLIPLIRKSFEIDICKSGGFQQHRFVFGCQRGIHMRI